MKLVQGVGINDSKEPITRYVNRKAVWRCDFYRVWADMLARGYSAKVKAMHPTYADCSVVSEWHRFSIFRDWMRRQDWQGKELDKDLIRPGNKVYGPDTCVFITGSLNKFMTDGSAIRGDWPLGVRKDPKNKGFISLCQNPFTGKQDYLGYFNSSDQAHRAWKARKLEHALTLASQQTDDRIAMALVARYNY